MLEDVFRVGGRLSKEFGGNYGYRPQQVNLAREVANTLYKRKVLFGEAPTGVGKSLAYLIPLLFELDRRQGSVGIICTGTKALQDQLWEKDLPLARSVVPEWRGNASVRKGRGAYLCFGDLEIYKEDFLNQMNPLLKPLVAWSTTTRTGDGSELGFPFKDWKEVAAKKETCRGDSCSFRGNCHYFRSKERSEQSGLIIMNHSLYFSLLATEGNIGENGLPILSLPPHDYVIFDEAHHVNSVATEAFSLSLSSTLIEGLCRKLKNISLIDKTKQERLKALNEDLFSPFKASGNSEGLVKSIVGERGLGVLNSEIAELLEILNTVAERLMEASQTAIRAVKRETYQALTLTTDHILKSFSDFLRAEDKEGDVFWYDLRENIVTLRHTPISIADKIKPLYEKKGVVFVSATLATGYGEWKGFRYLKEKLGVEEKYSELILDSPFDYPSQCMLYVPKDFPKPLPNPTEEYISLFVEEAVKLIELTKGGAFLLFTNKSTMEATYKAMQGKTTYKLMKQGDAPFNKTIADFKKDGSAVLFALRTYWEGVDIQGVPLRLVVIDRIPFPVFTSPLFKAQCDELERAGKPPFVFQSIPMAQVDLKQAFGRLIRTEEDYGIVAIMDSRLAQSNFKSHFINNLPPASRTGLFEKVERFWETVPERYRI